MQLFALNFLLSDLHSWTCVLVFIGVCSGTSLCVRTRGPTGMGNWLMGWPRWSNTWATSLRSTKWAGEQHHIEVHLCSLACYKSNRCPQKYSIISFYCCFFALWVIIYFKLNLSDPKSSSVSPKHCLPQRTLLRRGNTVLVRASTRTGDFFFLEICSPSPQI